MGGALGEVLIRRAVLRGGLRVQIYDGETVTPIQPDWAGITRCNDPESGRESFNLWLYRFDGTWVYSHPYDSLQIALDQGWDITGIHRSEWEACEVEVTDDQGKVPWHPSNEP